jgi:DNA polymerase V
MIALVDAHNAYVSMERVFRPSLVGKPVCVLSSGDGCAIARSEEAKQLGVKMGQPHFEFRDLERSAGLVCLSANFELYGDMSNRMMNVIAGLVPKIEIYSIDECFVDLTGMARPHSTIGHQIRDRVLQWVGIPTGVGIGPTKTLAKLANHIAKTAVRKPGTYPIEHGQVCDLGGIPTSEREALLAATPVAEIWGIGRKLAPKLIDAGVTTALALARLDPRAARARFSVVMEKLIRELQGVSCLALDDAPAPKQQIMVSRSFGNPVTTGRELAEAVSEYASRAAIKLRAQDCVCAQVHVFLSTSPFRKSDKQYSAGVTLPMVSPTGDTPALIQCAIHGLRSIYRAGFKYAKAGVMLLELTPASVEQGSLDFGQGLRGTELHAPNPALCRALDQINDRYGTKTIGVASAGATRPMRKWEGKQERRTPRYTTRWDEMLLVRA